MFQPSCLRHKSKLVKRILAMSLPVILQKRNVGKFLLINFYFRVFLPSCYSINEANAQDKIQCLIMSENNEFFMLYLKIMNFSCYINSCMLEQSDLA